MTQEVKLIVRKSFVYQQHVPVKS